MCLQRGGPPRVTAAHAAARFGGMLLLAADLVGHPLAGHAERDVYGHGDQVAERLVELSGASEARRLAAIQALGVSGDDRAFAPLAALAAAPAEPGTLRTETIHALAVLRDPRAVPVLLPLLERDITERTGLWSALIPALGALQDRRATPLLLRALNDRSDDWLGREMAAAALGEIRDPAAVPALLAAAHAGDTREAALAALAPFSDPRAAGVFVEALQQGESSEGLAAARQGLLNLGPTAVPALATALRARHPEFADAHEGLAIVDLLRQIGDPAAVTALHQAADSDPDPAVRAAAVEALKAASASKTR